MSDGLSEAHAFERMTQDLINAADKLRVAIEDAQDGYRGWAISDIPETINPYLAPVGWKIVPLPRAS